MPGVTSALNSYRAELAGLLGPAVVLQCLSPLLIAFEPTLDNTMVVACDNIRALEKTVVSRDKVKVSWKSIGQGFLPSQRRDIQPLHYY